MNVMVCNATAQASKSLVKKKLKEDASDLALLIYDIYKEKEVNGQNNANQNTNED